MTQQRSEETRARILDTAARKFAIAGYDAASVEDICTAAGVSKGAFYHHFPSKQAVFLALLNGWLSMIDKGMEAVRNDNIPQTLVKMTRLLPAVFATAEDRLPVFLEFWLQASRDENIWQAVIEPYRHYQEYFTRMVQAGIEEGSLKQTDPEMAARAIVSMAVGLVLQGVLDPQSADWAKVAESSMQILMNGLANG